MNKESIKAAAKHTILDKPLLFLMGFLAVIGVMYCAVVALNIHQSDVTVYSRYTAFGEAHFYKSHWQYLITFVIFGLIVTVTHLVLMVKLRAINRRQTALLVGWAGIVLLLLSLVYAVAVMTLGHTI